MSYVDSININKTRVGGGGGFFFVILLFLVFNSLFFLIYFFFDFSAIRTNVRELALRVFFFCRLIEEVSF